MEKTSVEVDFLISRIQAEAISQHPVKALPNATHNSEANKDDLCGPCNVTQEWIAKCPQPVNH